MNQLKHSSVGGGKTAEMDPCVLAKLTGMTQ
jgi:hypothetical protein